MEALKITKPISVYKKVRINLNSDYKWGEGWSTEQRVLFEEDVYPKLQHAGWTIVKSENSCISPTAYLDSDKTVNLYLHPMQFAGIMTKELVEHVCDILQQCNTVYRINSILQEDLYDLSADEYEKILADNEAEIREWVKEQSTPDNPLIAFEFAKRFRPRTIQFAKQGNFISEEDTDCVFVENIVKEQSA